MSVLILLVVGREQKIENLKPQASLFLGSLPKFILTTWSGSSPHSSVGKGSTCNAGDPNSIPVSGRSPGEGIGYPLQYSWPSLVAQLVKNLPAIQKASVRSLYEVIDLLKYFPRWSHLVFCFTFWELDLQSVSQQHGIILNIRYPYNAKSMHKI